MNARAAAILQYLEQHGKAGTNELTEIIGDYSKMTLWRDLKDLEEKGYIRRVHGGAVFQDRSEGRSIGAYGDRESVNRYGKRLIALKAKEFVQQNKSLYFDSGSTVMALIEALDNGRYTIITPGVNTAYRLSSFKDSIIIGLGGQLDPKTQAFGGAFTEMLIDKINIDTAFISCPGFSENGFSNSSISENNIKRKVIEKAGRVIMLMDSSKIDIVCPLEVASWKDIDYLIVDKPLRNEYIKTAKANKVKIITALVS